MILNKLLTFLSIFGFVASATITSFDYSNSFQKKLDSKEINVVDLDKIEKKEAFDNDTYVSLYNGIHVIGEIYDSDYISLISVSYNLYYFGDELLNIGNGNSLFLDLTFYQSNRLIINSFGSFFDLETTELNTFEEFDISSYELDSSNLDRLKTLQWSFTPSFDSYNLDVELQFWYTDIYNTQVYSTPFVVENVASYNINTKLIVNESNITSFDLEPYNNYFYDYVFNAYDTGYEYGYDEGYRDGLVDYNDTVGGQERFFDTFWGLIENAINTILNVFSFNILPGIPLFGLVALPFIIIIVIFVFKSLIK